MVRNSLLIAALFVIPGLAQSALEFEVATVKPGAPDARPIPAEIEEQVRFQGGPGSSTPDQIDYKSVTLQLLLRRAYSVKADQVIGPDWLTSDRYDISAKVPVGSNQEQVRLMLQRLVADRFHVRMHRDTKKLSVYTLTVAKGGPKLQPPEVVPVITDPEERRAELRKQSLALLQQAQARMAAGGPRSLRNFFLKKATVEKFAEMLSGYVQRPVKDQTQLTGSYSFHLEWVPDGGQPGSDGLSGPTIFAALEEQLGLTIKASNDEFEVLVIDGAERVPESN